MADAMGPRRRRRAVPVVPRTPPRLNQVRPSAYVFNLYSLIAGICRAAHSFWRSLSTVKISSRTLGWCFLILINESNLLFCFRLKYSKASTQLRVLMWNLCAINGPISPNNMLGTYRTLCKFFPKQLSREGGTGQSTSRIVSSCKPLM